jgi:hypothetical protein
MGGAEVHEVDTLAVEVQLHAAIERDHRQRLVRVGALGVLHPDQIDDMGVEHHVPGSGVRYQRGAGRPEYRVAVGVVEVPVGVDDKFRRAAAQAGDGGL